MKAQCAPAATILFRFALSLPLPVEERLPSSRLQPAKLVLQLKLYRSFSNPSAELLIMGPATRSKRGDDKKGASKEEPDSLDMLMRGRCAQRQWKCQLGNFSGHSSYMSELIDCEVLPPDIRAVYMCCLGM